MASQFAGIHLHAALASPDSLRVAELLPGGFDENVTIRLHAYQWHNVPGYDAISYAWENPEDRVPITVDGKLFQATRNLEIALKYLRSTTNPRYVWVDALCINQIDPHELGQQVRQMLKIYQKAKMVVIWVGPDHAKQALLAFEAVEIITSDVCKDLSISLGDPDLVLHKVIFENSSRLSDSPLKAVRRRQDLWRSLFWLFSHPYFTRAWAIQEISAQKSRIVQCGHATTRWEKLDVTAAYFTLMSSEFVDSETSQKTLTWWITTVAELTALPQQQRWLSTLYLASNYFCSDPRDNIYGLLGVISFNKTEASKVLEPDYTKTAIKVYRDSVEAAFVDFENADILLYARGSNKPSWIPNWNEAMLFRNPFRFGKRPPWKPLVSTKPVYDIDEPNLTLTLSGYVFGTVKQAIPYKESIFRQGQFLDAVNVFWGQVMEAVASQDESLPISQDRLAEVACSFSFGLDRTAEVAEESLLLHNFVAYLKTVLSSDVMKHFVPADLENPSAGVAEDFGQPVWDFDYPESTFFVMEDGMVGCCTSDTVAGDAVFIPLGGTLPLLIRRTTNHEFTLRGYGYVHKLNGISGAITLPELRTLKFV